MMYTPRGETIMNTEPAYNVPFAQGKTKQLFMTPEPDVIRVRTLDNLSAGDGARQSRLSVAANKNEQNDAVMSTLGRHGIPVAHIKKINETDSLQKKLTMLGVEFVVRGVPYGSFLKRNPEYVGKPMTEFDRALFEMFHKKTAVETGACDYATMMPEDEARKLYLKDGKWDPRAHCDPYIKPMEDLWGDAWWAIYDQKKPIITENRLACIDAEINTLDRKNIEGMAVESFDVLKRELGKLEINGKPLYLVDMKMEFGLDENGEIILGDVIDNDSWRILVDGEHIDKQLYRDGKSDEAVLDAYATVTDVLRGLPGREKE